MRRLCPRQTSVQGYSDGLLARFSRVPRGGEGAVRSFGAPEAPLEARNRFSRATNWPGSTSRQGSKLATGYSRPSSRSTRLSPGVR